jgi:hypothetical protein
MAETYRQRVDQWATRHPEWPVTFSFEDIGPEHQRTYICTYAVRDATTTATTSIPGEEKSTRAAAKESAAKKALITCELIAKPVRIPLQCPSAH